jgi:hypothetical protein
VEKNLFYDIFEHQALHKKNVILSVCIPFKNTVSPSKFHNANLMMQYISLIGFEGTQFTKEYIFVFFVQRLPFSFKDQVTFRFHHILQVT